MALFARTRNSALKEIEVRKGDFRVRLRRSPSGSVRTADVTRTVDRGENKAEVGVVLVDVVTPIAGVFYRSPSPGESPFVTEGDELHEGQVVGLIEAMKVFNEVVANVAGALVSFAAKEGTELSEGATVLRVRPDDSPKAMSDGPNYT